MTTKTGWRRFQAKAVAVLLLAGCAVQEPPAPPVESTAQALRDFSYTALGRGYDRALDIERADCFDRGPKTVTPINEWEAAGFVAFTNYELTSKVKTAVKVGVKIQNVEVNFGADTARTIGKSTESAYYVVLARFTSHAEAAGQILSAGNTCSNMSHYSANDVEDFVTLCGDSFLERKWFGGHVLVSWKMNKSNSKMSDDFGLNFGVTATNANFNAQVNFEKLVNAGYGDEEVLIEATGMPFPPTQVQLPSGSYGFTVKSALEYLKDVAQLSISSGTSPFVRVTDYELQRQTVPDMNLCLSVTGGQAVMTDGEWSCIHDRLTELADNRDGIGDRASLQADFERHRLAAEELLPANRLQFTTVLQSQCQIDADGDPAVEASGPCQAERLTSFVDFYKACVDASTVMLEKCRNNVLGTATTCRDFEIDCAMPQATLANGTVVACDEAGLTAALDQVIDYTVLPPGFRPPAGAKFTEPLVLHFDETPQRPIPGVSATTHLCAITGVRGGLHDSTVMLMPNGNDWDIEVKNGVPDPDKAVSVEVTCVNLENFVYLNGGAVKAPQAESVIVPALNGAVPFKSFLQNEGDTSLLGWAHYLSHPDTSLAVTNPDSTGYGLYLGLDPFPFISTNTFVGTHVIRANPSTGAHSGGELAFPRQGTSMDTVGLSPGSRQPLRISFPLPNDAFCYLTGLSGQFYNVSDLVRISKSDGMTTLITETPLTKDRNPGGRAQCIFYDQP